MPGFFDVLGIIYLLCLRSSNSVIKDYQEGEHGVFFVLLHRQNCPANVPQGRKRIDRVLGSGSLPSDRPVSKAVQLHDVTILELVLVSYSVLIPKWPVCRRSHEDLDILQASVARSGAR